MPADKKTNLLLHDGAWILVLGILSGGLYGALIASVPALGVFALYFAFLLPLLAALYAGYLVNVHDAEHWHAAIAGILLALVYEFVVSLLSAGVASLETVVSNAVMFAISALLGSYVAHRHLKHGSRHFPKPKIVKRKPRRRKR